MRTILLLGTLFVKEKKLSSRKHPKSLKNFETSCYHVPFMWAPESIKTANSLGVPVLSERSHPAIRRRSSMRAYRRPSLSPLVRAISTASSWALLVMPELL
jgi:hypothetical protein